MSAATHEVQPRPKRWLSRRWIVWGGAGLAAVVAAVVALVMVLRPTPLVKPGQLDSLLLDAAQINTIMGASDMQASKPQLEPANPTSTLSNPNCLGALTAAQAPTYASSGYTELHWVALKEPGKIAHYVAQAVAVFPDVDKANAFVQSSAAQWDSCAGQTVTVTGGGSTATWALGSLTRSPPSIALSETRTDVQGWTNQRAMRAVSNVVIDISAAGGEISDQASQIADRIAANVPK